MPDLFLPDPSGLDRSPGPGMVQNTETLRDSRPGGADGLSPEVVTGLDEARRNGLTSLYGADWEAAGERLARAFEAEGPAAYDRLAREPGAYGTVSGDPTRAETVAGGLWAREVVLAEVRGTTLPGSSRSEERGAPTTDRDQTLDRDPPVRLRPGESLAFRDPKPILIPAGGRTRGYGGAPVAGGPPVVPIAVTVSGGVNVRSVERIDGRDMATMSVSAVAELSTNGAGPARQTATSGRLVDVTSGRDGRSYPFTLRDEGGDHILPSSPGGSRYLGGATVSVPAGRTYEVRIDVATDLPNRGLRLAPRTYISDPPFTPTDTGRAGSQP